MRLSQSEDFQEVIDGFAMGTVYVRERACEKLCDALQEAHTILDLDEINFLITEVGERFADRHAVNRRAWDDLHWKVPSVKRSSPPKGHS